MTDATVIPVFKMPEVGEAFTVHDSHQVVVDVEVDATRVLVVRDANGQYHVARDGKLRHPGCNADSAMAALGVYLHSALYKLSKLENS